MQAEDAHSTKWDAALEDWRSFILNGTFGIESRFSWDGAPLMKNDEREEEMLL